jgi:peptidylprolyl isomerase
MKPFSFVVAALICFSTHALCSKEPKGDQKKEITKVSEAFGHLIGKNLESIGLELDIQAIVKGLKDSAAGKTSPMTENECIQAISAAQESVFIEMSEKNLVQANDFLEKNKKIDGIVSCEEGQVQYKIDKEGTGESLKPGDTPLIQYVGKFLDGSVFGDSKEPEPFALDEVISGLKTGLLGMKEGEKRTIFIHPDQAYGTKGSLPPNSLLTFEIELLKTQAPIAAVDSFVDLEDGAEIALPEHAIENVR